MKNSSTKNNLNYLFINKIKKVLVTLISLRDIHTEFSNNIHYHNH